MEKPNPEKEKGKLPENYKHFKKPIPPLNSEELEAELGDVFNAAGEYLDKEKTEENLKKDENLIWVINEENKNKKQGAIEQRQREEKARDQLAEQAKRDDEDDYEDEYDYDYESDSLEKANQKISHFLKHFSGFELADISTEISSQSLEKINFKELEYTNDPNIIWTCLMLNQDYFHVDFEKYAPVFPSYPGSASNERLSDVMVKIKYDHANDDYYYLPGIEFLQKMMKEMNSSKKTQFPRVWRIGMTFILPGTLFGLPNGSWSLLGYGVNKGFDGKLYFFLEKIPLNKAMEKNYQILVFRKKIS